MCVEHTHTKTRKDHFEHSALLQHVLQIKTECEAEEVEHE